MKTTEQKAEQRAEQRQILIQIAAFILCVCHVLRYLLDTISLIKAGWGIHDISKTISERMNGDQYA